MRSTNPEAVVAPENPLHRDGVDLLDEDQPEELARTEETSRSLPKGSRGFGRNHATLVPALHWREAAPVRVRRCRIRLPE